MILYIDTHIRGKVNFGLLKSDKVECYQASGRTDILLSEMNKQLPQKWIDKIKAIAIINGPGPFSAIRGGVLVSNLLARSLNIPLYTFSVSEFNAQNSLFKIQNKEIKPVVYASPIYDAEPNITC